MKTPGAKTHHFRNFTLSVLVVGAVGAAAVGGAELVIKTQLPGQHSNIQLPATSLLPSDPGYGRQLTDWKAFPGTASSTARFCDPATKMVIVVDKSTTAPGIVVMSPTETAEKCATYVATLE